MSKKDLVSEEVLQELINKLEEIVNNYCHNLEYFTEDEVNDFFNADSQEITYYSSLIKDDVVSKNFLHSSKQIADDIAKSILEANEYTDNLVKNISSIQLEWCATNLPTTGENNKIYILPVTSGSTTTINTLNIWNNTSNDWVSIGNLEIDITQFYNKSEIDTKMDLKANKTEVVANDKIVQTLDSATNSSDTVLSTSGLQAEMDKKANDDEVIKKTDITTTIDSTSTDSELPTARTIYEKTKNMCTTTVADSSGIGTVTPEGTTGYVAYKVINGICYVEIKELGRDLVGDSVSNITGLPVSSTYVNASIEYRGSRVGTVYCESGASKFSVIKSATMGGFGSFSYPVAEN